MKKILFVTLLLISNITFVYADTTMPICEGEYDKIVDFVSLPDMDNLMYATRLGYKYEVTNIKDEKVENYYKFDGFYSDPNRNSYAYKAKLTSGSEMTVKDGDIYSGDNPDIAELHISNFYRRNAFSPDGGSFSYIAIDDSALGKWKTYAFKDGERIGKGYQDISGLIYSQEGNVLNYVGGIRGKQVLVRDGDEVSDTFDSINWLQYSSDGKSYYFSGKQNSKIFHIKDGEEISGEGVQEFQFLPNSQSYVYIKSLANGKKVIVKDEVQITNEENGFSGLTFSPDGKSFSYFREVGDKYVLVKDGVELGKRYLFINDIYYSSDNSIYYIGVKSYHSKTNDFKKVLVRDGEELIPEYADNQQHSLYNYIEGITYSPDGEGFMYQMDMGDQWLLIKDNKEILKSEYGLAHLEYSSTGESYYYTIHSLDGRTLVRDGVELGKYKNIKDIEYGSGDKLTFLSDNVLYSDYCEKEEGIETEKDSSDVISDENNIGNDLDDSDDVRVIDPKVESKIMNFVTKLESSLNGDIEKLNNKLHGLIQALEEYSIKHPKYELLIEDIIYLLDKKISE